MKTKVELLKGIISEYENNGNVIVDVMIEKYEYFNKEYIKISFKGQSLELPLKDIKSLI